MGTEVEGAQEQRGERDWHVIALIAFVIAAVAINLAFLALRTVCHVHGGPI